MPKLPKDILIKRVKQEILMCQRKLPHKIVVKDETFTEMPIKLKVTMAKTPGPIWKGDKLSTSYNHEFIVAITEDYPYEKPIVRWRTDIFHPNIMTPEEEGHVCTKLLDDWSFSSNLLAFINGIESLLSEPNPGNPWGSDTCMKAAHYFVEHEYNPPMISAKKGPMIVSDKKD